MAESHSEIQKLIDVCHRLYTRGMVTATDGNVSVRRANGNILATRSGVNKGMVSERDFVEVSLDGKQLTGTSKPSSEIGMHLFIYRQRSDAMAVVHAHPPYATGFATARIPLTQCTFPEVILGLGAIPLAEYATPSTPEVADSLAPFVMTSEAVLLANHGAVTFGSDLYDAYFKMEKIEHAAHITFVAQLLGGAHSLSLEDLSKLRNVSMQNYEKDVSNKIACEIRDVHAPEEIKESELRSYVELALRERGIQ